MDKHANQEAQIETLRMICTVLLGIGMAAQLAFLWYFNFRYDNIVSMLGPGKPLPWLVEAGIFYFFSPFFWIFGVGSSVVAIVMVWRRSHSGLTALAAILAMLISFSTILPASIGLELTHASILRAIIKGAKDKGLIK